MDYVLALVPSIGTGILFFVVIRAIVNADRNERAALDKLDREERENRSPQPPAGR